MIVEVASIFIKHNLSDSGARTMNNEILLVINLTIRLTRATKALANRAATPAP
jgi:hypothetical protein